MELLTGLMELLPYFLCARLSAAVVISLSSPGFKCCFRALLHFVRSQVQSQPRHSVAVDTLHISYADIFISEVTAGGCFPPQCLLTLDYVLWDSTILHTANMTQPSLYCLCRVYWEDQHDTGHRHWILCLAIICPGQGGCFSCRIG